MAQFATKKRTHLGKTETCSRKAVRRVKYGTGQLDTQRLEREIGGLR